MRGQLGLQGHQEGVSGSGSRVGQLHLGRHFGQMAADVHRALHILIDELLSRGEGEQEEEGADGGTLHD